jgi:hypothetical protein
MFLPPKLIYVALLLKILSALPMDFIDICTDALYFYQISSTASYCENSVPIIDRRIQIGSHVYHILFFISISAVAKIRNMKLNLHIMYFI